MADNTGKRVLVVDDASLVRMYYRQALEAAGFVVEEALNGLEALEKVLIGPVDLLVVDVNMPQMDGLTFVAALRGQSGAIASTPVLITSSESGVGDAQAARVAGANFYLVKPLTQEQLALHARILTGWAA